MKINGSFNKEGIKFFELKAGDCFAFMDGCNKPENNLFLKTKVDTAVRLFDGLVYESDSEEENNPLQYNTMVKKINVELNIL